MSNAYDPAYPMNTVVHGNGNVEWGTPGLTKRELFAAMAMQSFVANPEMCSGAEVIARSAVIAADALLAELAKAGT